MKFQKERTAGHSTKKLLVWSAIAALLAASAVREYYEIRAARHHYETAKVLYHVNGHTIVALPDGTRIRMLGDWGMIGDEMLLKLTAERELHPSYQQYYQNR